MKPKQESLLGTLAILGLAVFVAYLGPERHHSHPSSSAAPSDKAATPDDDFAAGRGRRADSPRGIPVKGWKDILWRTYEQINEDRLLAVSAGVVFYGLLALFPAVTALVSSYALFADTKTVNDHMAFLGGFLPEGNVFNHPRSGEPSAFKGRYKTWKRLSWKFAFSNWSANGGMKAIIDALNVVYDEKEKRGIFKLNAVSLMFTIGGVIGILIAIGLVVAIPLALSAIGLDSATDLLIRFGRWPVLGLLLLLALAIVYRYAPSRESPKWRWISVGSVVATVTWMSGSGLLSFYLANFGHYDAAYGSLGAAIALMIWMWMSTIVVLFGAELNSEIEHQTMADSTTESAKPLGARGATMADTVGASH